MLRFGAAPDRVLLAELALLGYFAEVPEELFLHREHEIARSTTAAVSGSWSRHVLRP